MLQWVLSIFLAFMTLFIIMLMTTLNIFLHVKKDGKNDLINTRIKAWFGLIKLEFNIPMAHIAEDFSGTQVEVEMETSAKTLENQKKKIRPSTFFRLQQQMYQNLKRIHNMLPILRKFLRSIRLDKLEWRTIIGTADAADTGVLSGIIWGIKSSMIGFMSSYLTLRQIPRISVQPHFQEKKLETELLCMIRVRIGNAILAGIRLLLNLRKRRDKAWQSTQFRA